VCGYTPSRGVLERKGVKEMRSTRMICVTVEIHEGAVTQRARVTAPSIEGALKFVEGGKSGRKVCLVFPVDPEAFFVPARYDRRDAA
jgi:hypothetical protein